MQAVLLVVIQDKSTLIKAESGCNNSFCELDFKCNYWCIVSSYQCGHWRIYILHFCSIPFSRKVSLRMDHTVEFGRRGQSFVRALSKSV